MSSLAFTCSGEGQIYPGVAGHVLPQVMSDQPHGRIAVRRLMCIPFSRNIIYLLVQVYVLIHGKLYEKNLVLICIHSELTYYK